MVESRRGLLIYIMSSTSDISKGVVIRHQNDLWLVTFAKFVSPGKGSAFTRVRMKSITSGKSLEVTYKSSETVDIVDVQYQRLQYLYHTGNFYSFMNNDTFENYELSAEDLGDDAKFLKEGMEVKGVLFEDRVVAVTLPAKIQYKVVEAPPAVKGDTASSGRLMKDIKLENGLVIKAPIFIRENDTILVNTEDGEYCERINE